jgi:hypothetical protein
VSPSREASREGGEERLSTAGLQQITNSLAIGTIVQTAVIDSRIRLDTIFE